MFQKWLHLAKVWNGETHYLKPEKNKFVINHENGNGLVNQILRSYNFLGVVERMEESVVALQMVLGLETSDVMFLDSKRSGTPGIQSTYVTPGMKEFFDSQYYKDKIFLDDALYKAINASLDKTIDKLGRPEFEKQLEKLRSSKKLVTETCTKEKWAAHLGTDRLKPPEWCVAHSDWGCGFDCFDYVLKGGKLKNQQKVNQEKILA